MEPELAFRFHADLVDRVKRTTTPGKHKMSFKQREQVPWTDGVDDKSRIRLGD